MATSEKTLPAVHNCENLTPSVTQCLPDFNIFHRFWLSVVVFLVWLLDWLGFYVDIDNWNQVFYSLIEMCVFCDFSARPGFTLLSDLIRARDLENAQLRALLDKNGPLCMLSMSIGFLLFSHVIRHKDSKWLISKIWRGDPLLWSKHYLYNAACQWWPINYYQSIGSLLVWFCPYPQISSLFWHKGGPRRIFRPKIHIQMRIRKDLNNFEMI